MTEKQGFLSSNGPLVMVSAVAVVLIALILLSMGLEPDGEGKVTAVGNEEFLEAIDDGARLVDVRTEAEYESGHIPGAELAPVTRIAAIAEDWDRSQPLAVYCATGNRSADASRVLAQMGFEVYDLKTGIVGWDGEVATGEAVAEAPAGDEGGPAETGEGLPVMYEFVTDT